MHGRGFTYDDTGWVIGAVDLLPRAAAVSVFVPDAAFRWDVARLRAAAARERLGVRLEPEKKYPSAAVPAADVVTLVITGVGVAECLIEARVVPTSRAAVLTAEARRTAQTIGGAGMDAVVSRARHVVQIAIEPSGADPSALATSPAHVDGVAAGGWAAAFLLSSAHLGAVMGPTGGVFGPRTALERMRRAGTGPSA